MVHSHNLSIQEDRARGHPSETLSKQIKPNKTRAGHVAQLEEYLPITSNPQREPPAPNKLAMVVLNCNTSV